jgi:NADH-quinone oxidoreductase subunit L
MKVTAITCAIGGLALAGIFPLAGFFSKDKLLEAALAVALGKNADVYNVIPTWVGWLILIMALATVLMTAFYTTRMWTLVFLGKPRSHGAEHAHEAPVSMRISLVVLAAITCVAGLLFIPHWTGLIAPEHEILSSTLVYGMTGLSLLLAVTGILWGYRVYGKAPAKEPLRKLGPIYAGMVNLWYVDAFFTWFAQKIVLGLAHVTRKFDKQVIDGGLVDGTAWSTGRLGHLLRRVGAGPLPGQLQYYALVIFLVAVLVMLGMSAHQYLGAAHIMFGK